MIVRDEPATRSFLGSVLANGDFWLAIALGAFILWAAQLTADLPAGGVGTEFGAGFVPWLCIGGLGILTALLLIRSVRQSCRGERFTVDLSPRLLTKLGVFVMLMLVYGFAYLPFGYLISTGIFFVVAMLALGERRVFHVAVIPAAITFGVWVVFVHVLKVILP
jgi:putative tricarboxylic transport membrane protein